jgi:hypothetical protein
MLSMKVMVSYEAGPPSHRLLCGHDNFSVAGSVDKLKELTLKIEELDVIWRRLSHEKRTAKEDGRCGRARWPDVVPLLTAPPNVNEEGGTGTTCVNKASNDLTVSFCRCWLCSPRWLCLVRKKKAVKTRSRLIFSSQLQCAIDNDIYIDHVIFGASFHLDSLFCAFFFRRMNRAAAAAAFSSARRCNRQRCGADWILTDAILDIFCVCLPPPAGFTSPIFFDSINIFVASVPVLHRLHPSVIRFDIHLLSRSGAGLLYARRWQHKKNLVIGSQKKEEVHVDAAENGWWRPRHRSTDPKNGPMTCANSSIDRRKWEGVPRFHSEQVECGP